MSFPPTGWGPSGPPRSVFGPPAGSDNDPSSRSSGPPRSVFAMNAARTPYDDQYQRVLGGMKNVISLYEIALSDISQVVVSDTCAAKYQPSQGLPNESSELALSEKLTTYNQRLRELGEGLESLARSGERPMDQSLNTDLDGLIFSSVRLMSSCVRNSKDPCFNDPKRQLRWHFSGAIENFEATTTRLLNVSRQFFSETSTWTGPRNEEMTRLRLRSAKMGM